MASKPSVMVSSTFFDLRQIRSSLSEFLEEQMGYEPLLSELPSFPIDPDLDTISNCRRRVEQSADILVLLIGGRYGSLDSQTKKSVTNLEYLEARRKGIPVYSFVEKGILSILNVWKNNPNADYSHVVDTPRVFEFITQVRSVDQIWMFPFETVKDIVEVLRAQFGHLLLSGLQIMRKIDADPVAGKNMDELGPAALRIMLEKPTGWEYLLFLQIWKDKVESQAGGLYEYRFGLKTGIAENVPFAEATNWIMTRLHELKSYTNTANTLLNENAQHAFGPPGQPGDESEIVQVAKKMGRVLADYLEWYRRVAYAHVAEPLEKAVAEMSKFPDRVIDRLQQFPVEAMRQLEEAIKDPSEVSGGELHLTMTFELANEEPFEHELSVAQRRIEQGDF